MLPDPEGTPEPRDESAPPPVGEQVRGSLTYAGGTTTNAVPRPRSRNLDVPDVASDVAGAGAPDVHDTGIARAAGIGVSALAVLLVLAFDGVVSV